MKRKLISIIGLGLFVCAIGFNSQINSTDNKQDEVTLNSIKILTASASEASCTCKCEDGSSCTGYETCDCTSDWIKYCDDVTLYCES